MVNIVRATKKNPLAKRSIRFDSPRAGVASGFRFRSLIAGFAMMPQFVSTGCSPIRYFSTQVARWFHASSLGVENKRDMEMFNCVCLITTPGLPSRWRDGWMYGCCPKDTGT